jgi:hypothetical protein
MSFKKNDASEELVKFEKLLQDIDDHIKAHGKAQASVYFPGTKPEHLDVLFENTYRPVLKPAKAGTDYPNTVVPKVGVTKDNNFLTKVYDTTKNELPFNKIPKGSNVIGILCINSLYFAGKTNWGVTLSLPQLLVFPSKKLDGFQIKLDESEMGNTHEMESAQFEFAD